MGYTTILVAVKQKCNNEMLATYIDPHLQRCRIDFVQLVKVAIYDSFLRKAILLSSSNKNALWNFFSSSCLIISLKGVKKKRPGLNVLKMISN